MRLLVGVLAVFLSFGAFADECSNLLTTSFGFRGPWTAYLNSKAVLSIVKDGYSEPLDGEDAPDGRVPRLRIKAQQLSSTLRSPRSFASLAASLEDSAFYSTVSEDGTLSLTLPDGRTFPVHLKDTIDATALYRLSVRHFQTQGEAEQVNRREFVELSKKAERFLPIHLYYSVGRRIYDLTVRYQDLTGENEDLVNQARTGLTEVILGDDGKYLYWTQSPLSWLDFNQTVQKNHSILIPTPEEGIVIEVSKPQAVFEFKKETEMQSIDFLHAIGPNQIVAGSTIGQVAVVNVSRSEITHRPNFPGPAFIGSLSAHHNGKAVEVWAVDAARHILLRWDSQQISPQFQPIVSFPADADPFQVATFSGRVPYAFQLDPESPHSYFSNFRGEDADQARIERVLVQDAGGRIHALRDRAGQLLNVEREWVSPQPVP